MLGLLKCHLSDERRVPLLPSHIGDFGHRLVIEEGFGDTLEISDQAYLDRGCQMMTRDEIIANCDNLYSLKGLPKEDWHRLRSGQLIMGWLQPKTKGKVFIEENGRPKDLIVVELENAQAEVYYQDKVLPIPFIPKNFSAKNSQIAGQAAVLHGLISYGQLPKSSTEVAVLGAGNASQGAFAMLSKLGASQSRLYYRKTLTEFRQDFNQFNLVVNGIGLSQEAPSLVTKSMLEERTKPLLIIDISAKENGAIEGIHQTTLENPLYKEGLITYYCINNTPSLLYREASEVLSESFSRWVFNQEMNRFRDLV